jgi:hypothetical protein
MRPVLYLLPFSFQEVIVPSSFTETRASSLHYCSLPVLFSACDWLCTANLSASDGHAPIRTRKERKPRDLRCYCTYHPVHVLYTYLIQHMHLSYKPCRFKAVWDVGSSAQNRRGQIESRLTPLNVLRIVHFPKNTLAAGLT